MGGQQQVRYLSLAFRGPLPPVLSPPFFLWPAKVRSLFLASSSAGSQSTLGWRHLASYFHQVAPVTVGTPDGTALPSGDVDDQASRPVGTGVNQTPTHQKLLLVLVPVGCG